MEKQSRRYFWTYKILADFINFRIFKHMYILDFFHYKLLNTYFNLQYINKLTTMSTEERRSLSAKRRNVLAPEDNKPSDSAKKALQAIKKRKKNSIWDQYSYHIIIGGFILIIAVTLLTTLLGKTKKLHLTPVIENDEIEAHNHNNYGYKLGPNSFFQVKRLFFFQTLNC